MIVVQLPAFARRASAALSRTFAQMSVALLELASLENALSVTATCPATPVKLPLLAVLEPPTEQPPAASARQEAAGMSARRTHGGEPTREPARARSATRSSRCRRCPRLVAWREQVARERRAAFAAEEYWGRPVPGFGDPDARDRDPRAGARRPRRQPHRPRVHRRPLRRLPLRRALARRARQPADVALARRRAARCDGAWITAAVRCAPPGQPADARRSATTACRSRGASSSCCRRARDPLPRARSPGRRRCASSRRRCDRARASATAASSPAAGGVRRCSAATTPASRTRSPAA